MENTGRIMKSLTPSAQRIVFGVTAEQSIMDELPFITQVDQAHLVMLAEQRIVRSEQVAALLAAILDLRLQQFAPLRGRSALRGVYLLYEDYLGEKLGPEVGGILQTARSRNDLNATVLRLRLRAPYLALVSEALRLQAALQQRARQHAGVVMPAYTHYQAAVPITYGHYLAGVAVSLERELTALLDIVFDLQACPLGAGAVGGTSLPIQPARTAELLGFHRSVLHAVEAVASRNFVLRLLASMVTWGTTLSRLANDFLLWMTAEFGFLTLPDTLVGSSSMMPQKRNPFLLEHVLGKSAFALGAFTMAATAMHGKPFTNSIAVGTEAVSSLEEALRKTTEATALMRLVLLGARPEQQRLLERAEAGYTTATELANRLMREKDMSFRRAHHQVGTWVRQAIEQGNLSLPALISQHSAGQSQEGLTLSHLDTASVVQLTNFGGGPGPQSLAACLQQLRLHWGTQVQQKRSLVQSWYQAERLLQTTVQAYLDMSTPGAE